MEPCWKLIIGAFQTKSIRDEDTAYAERFLGASDGGASTGPFFQIKKYDV